MKTYLLLLSLLSFIFSQGQGLRKDSISNSGCTLYMYCDIKYEIKKSEDSSQLYTGECTVGDITYGVICVRLLTPIAELTMAEDLLIAYLDYLKSNFEIVKSAGYSRGQRLNNNENTRGIIDYWEDAELNKWKIKAWTDGKYIGVLYAKSKKELPDTKVNVFLDSFGLPDK